MPKYKVKHSAFSIVMSILFLICTLGSVLCAIIIFNIWSLERLSQLEMQLKYKYTLMEDSDRYEIEFFGTLSNNSANDIKDCRVEIIVKTDYGEFDSFDYTLYVGFIGKNSQKDFSHTIKGMYKPVKVDIIRTKDGYFTNRIKGFFICLGIFVGSVAIFIPILIISNKLWHKKIV